MKTNHTNSISIRISRISLLFVLLIGLSAQTANAVPSNADFIALPAGTATPVKPNVIINLSAEVPMQGAAYNDHVDEGDPNFACTGNFARESGVGRCYHPKKVYVGYFDPKKCYSYSASSEQFNPEGAADKTEHTCSSQYSGNFMNWATTSAIDGFKFAMTGGHRDIDTTTETVLQRNYHNDGNWFHTKKISSAINVNPNQVTPFSLSVLDGEYLYISRYQDSTNKGSIDNISIKFGITPGGEEKQANVRVRVKVCDLSAGLEDNCQAYTDASGNVTYKPIGLLQEFSDQMRFSLFSYLHDDGNGRQGGVMRARMKSLGPTTTDAQGNNVTNLNSEWHDDTGIFIENPDPTDATTSNVTNSGVINYLNKFGKNGYKSNDPVSEMYYECLRYYRNKAPTPSAVSNLTATHIDDFPVIVWDPSTDDPVQAPCQKNYIVGLNDVYAWQDKSLPGTAVTSGTDSGSPVSDDTLNVSEWTKKVGEAEFTSANNLENFQIRGVRSVTGGALTGNLGTLTASTLDLGETFTSGRTNSFYVAGMAYWANTQDIRPDLGIPTADGTGDSAPTTVQTFFVDSQEYQSSPTVGPESMLYLAAKYGGFKDLNGNGIPDNDAEWSTRGLAPRTAINGPNSNIEYKAPDNFAQASNPQAMIDGLRNAFTAIAQEQERSSSAPANLANSDGNGGLLVQALYFQDQSNDDNTENVAWTGQIHAFFVDEFGLFRDDSGSVDNALDSDDKVFIYEFIDGELKISRFLPRDNAANEDDLLVPFGSPIDLDELATIWSAQEVLASYDNDAITTQRTYDSIASSTGASRHIVTLIDENLDGDGEQVDFVAANIDADNQFIFGTQGADDTEKLNTAKNVVDFIRGYEDPNGTLRNRTLDQGEATEKTFRLGDIVNSTPVIVGSPEGNYDATAGDTSYADFATQYSDRREVIYFGANDGLIHAFNVGFRTSDANSKVKFVTTNDSRTAHSLGAELWAYAPNSLLPHLQWLSSPTYGHVFYADGEIQTYDVKIFNDDTDHPNGWGTILVAGLRLGGGDFPLDTDGDAVADHTTRSAFVILDITNPEAAPTVLAEISDPDLNFTTNLPVIEKDLASNEWTLVFGNGPDSANYSSSETAKVFTYDISDLGKSTTPQLISDISNGNTYEIAAASDSFVGSFTVKDWDSDFVDDALYFGTVGTKTTGTGLNAVISDTGSLYRFLNRFNNGASKGVNLMFDADRPIQGRPLAAEVGGKEWVYFGTGRYFNDVDSINPGVEFQERYYGIIEQDSDGDGQIELSGSSVTSDLLDISNVRVFLDDPATPNQDESGLIEDPDNAINDSSVKTTADLANFIIDQKEGWYRNLPTNGTTPSDRFFTKTNSAVGLLFFTTFEPDDNLCDARSGSSDIYGIDMLTGTATGFGIFEDTNGDNISDASISLDEGRASEVILFLGGGLDSDKGRGFIQLDNGRLVNLPLNIKPTPTPSSRRRSWREIILD